MRAMRHHRVQQALGDADAARSDARARARSSIRVHASGMCGTDLHVHHGMFPLHAADRRRARAGRRDRRARRRRHRPARSAIASACSGTRRAAAAAPSARRAAQTTAPRRRRWMHLGGGNSELMLAWASGCALSPTASSYEAAAPIFCAGYTVMSGLRNARPASPASASRSSASAASATSRCSSRRRVGLETVALTGQADKKAELTRARRRRGRSSPATIPARRSRDAGGADVILSTTNSAKQIAQRVRGPAPDGRLINMGVPDGPIAIDPMALMMGQRQLRGSSQDERSDLFEALQLVAAGKVKPNIETYPLARGERRPRAAGGRQGPLPRGAPARGALAGTPYSLSSLRKAMEARPRPREDALTSRRAARDTRAGQPQLARERAAHMDGGAETALRRQRLRGHALTTATCARARRAACRRAWRASAQRLAAAAVQRADRQRGAGASVSTSASRRWRATR